MKNIDKYLTEGRKQYISLEIRIEFDENQNSFGDILQDVSDNMSKLKNVNKISIKRNA